MLITHLQFSTIVEFQAIDYMMESCELSLQMSSAGLYRLTNNTEGFEFEIPTKPGGPSDSITISLYELDSINPLPMGSLSYRTRPARRSNMPVLTFNLSKAVSSLDVKHRYSCRLNSLRAFELSASGSGKVAWVQDPIDEEFRRASLL